MNNSKSKSSNSSNNNRSNRKFNNSKKYNRRPQSKKTDIEPVKEDAIKSGHPKDDINDSSFYYTSEDLKRQLTDYTLTGFLGMPTPLGAYFEHTDSNKVVMYTGLPSIMRVMINPAIETERLRVLLDFSSTKAMGMTKVGLKNYYLLSANNAKTTNYQPHDVTMLILALGQIAAYVGYVRRIFGSAFKYNIRNRDLPNELITGMHVDYADFANNMANYRIRFNTILNSLNRLPIPGNIAYITKWGSMYSNLYLDEYNNDLAQWYMLVPNSFWKFNETKSDTGSGFDTVEISDGTKLSTILATLEEMIQAVIESSTFHYIFSDILRLNEKGGFPILQFNMCLEGEDAPVLFSEEFNLWIDNAEITGKPLTSPTETTATASNDVFTNVATGDIVYNPYFEHRSLDMNRLANFKDGAPDIEKKIAATRLKHMRSWSTSGARDESGIACGDCYVTEVQILADAPWTNRRQWGDISFRTNGYLANFISSPAVRQMGIITQFNYAPKIALYDSTDTDVRNATVLGQLDYFTQIPAKVLYEMWDAEWLGLIEMR